MVTELPMKGMPEAVDRESHTCIVQYILFPPHSTSTKDSFSTDDDNDTEVEAIDVDTELNLVTECWVEPQSGTVWSPRDQHRHFQELTYQEIPQAIFPRDLTCMSTIMTFEYLSQLCQNKEQVYPPIGTAAGEPPASEDCIHTVPFQFDLIELLPKCQQIEIFFLTLSRVENEEVSQSTPYIPNELLLSLFHSSLQQELSDREIPLADQDNVTFMHHILDRERDGHVAPFSLPVIRGRLCKCEPVPVERDGSTPQWKCYAKYISPQQIFLTFLPATFTDVQMLMSSGLETEPQDNGDDDDTLTTGNKSQADSQSGSTNGLYGGLSSGLRSPMLSPGGAGPPQKRDFHITFSRQTSQQSSGDLSRPRCPVYVYNCSLDSLKDQLLNPHSNRQPRDIFFRSLSQERSSTSSWTDLMSQPHKHKELANYCSLLQEHYHQCYVTGVYRSLQQSHSISSQDLLTAMDYCEESLQEIDITSFLQTLCGHIRVFRERHGDRGVRGHSITPATFTIGEAEEDGPVKRGPMASSSSIEMEDVSEAENRGKASAPNSPLGLDEPPGTIRIPETVVKLANACIQQDKFMDIGAQFFKTVPSNPHYFYYCPPSSKKETCVCYFLSIVLENMSGCCIMMESDTDLEVEYLERAGGRRSLGTDGEGEAGGEGEDESLSDSNTVNQDEDSFSILEGDSLLEPEGPQPEMPPLFVHLTCSVNMKSCHGSMPITTLPTCLGEYTLYLTTALQGLDLNDLSVTLDIFVLTLPLEIEGMQSDLRHNRYTSESSVSLNRSPGQPSSYRSDEELMGNLDSLRGVGIRWLLEDEIVSALRLSRVIRSSTLQKVADHVFRSGGRPRCHCEVVPLQFVFGPEQSLEKFKEVWWEGDQKTHLLLSSGSGKLRPSRVQSVVSSQGSLDSDMLGYDGGSSDSECESPTVDEQESQAPLMPDFWLIVKIHQDRVEVYSQSRVEEKEEEEEEVPEYLRLHQMVVRKIGEICRIVNQRLLLQDLHDSHVCNSLLVAESEEDIWKNESLYRQRLANSDDYNAEESYQPRDYLAATMQFIPGHFACEVVWSTVIHIHPRLKMGPNMGVSRAIQALRSVLNAMCVVNRKSMFVYQERSTKSVFYLRLALVPPSLSSLLQGSFGARSSLEGARPVGQVDKHILLLVHGVGSAGPEITDELVKVLRKRLDETTLDIITIMLGRNCKLTPADVEFIQPSGSPATEVMEFTLPQCFMPWTPAVAHYLRQNLLIFLHIPKYTDSYVEHHFKHYFHQSSELPDSDVYLYNKPGGQGTGGKGNEVLSLFSQLSLHTHHPLTLSAHSVPAQCPSLCLSLCLALSQSCTVPLSLSLSWSEMRVRFDIWEQGNVSPLQLTDKLRGALRHALCDVIMELRVLPNPLCLETFCTTPGRGVKNSPSPITLIPAPLGTTPNTGPSTPESTTPTGKTTRRSFWEILSKPDSSELGSPKTTDDIVQEKGEEGRTRRRHKTENVKQQWSQEKAMAVELEQAQRRHVSQLEEGDIGTLHPLYQVTCQPWITFMAKLGCPSIQQCTAEIASQFLLPPILTEIVNLVSSLASDTAVKVFERTRWGFQRFEALEQSDCFSPGQASRGVAPRQRFLLIHILDKKVTLYTYNWSVDLGVSLNRGLVRLVQWQNARSHVIHCLLNQKMGLFHHYCFSDTPAHEDLKQEPNPFLNPTLEADALLRSPVPPVPSKDQGRLASSVRSLAPLHFPSELVPFDEALRDIGMGRPLASAQDGADVVARHGAQLLEVKAAERREMEKQMKIENLFVTWQQRSAQSNMPISVVDLDTLKQSSRLVHYCATPLLFDPVFSPLLSPSPLSSPPLQKRHCSSDSTASGRDRSYSTDSADMLPSRLREEPWLQDISNTFLQQYVQYLQSMGFILVQVRPQSPARSSLSSERQSFSYNKARSEDSPKSTGSGTTAYHLQRALPGGIVLMELAFQGCYFCVKQYALECSRIPMGQTVNSQLSMLFTEECDKVRDLMHVHSFSYDFHLRVVHQYLVGCHMTLRQGYQLTGFLEDFIAHHPDIPKFGRNHVFQGSFSISTGMITAHQLYNYITDHAGTYGMKPLRISDLHEYALVALWNSSGSYKDLEGLRHHDDFDVSLLVCHNAAPFEEQSEGERHLLRLRYYVIMTSQRELFPRLTADMRRFKKLPQIHREARDLGGKVPPERGTEPGGGLLYPSPLFPLLNQEVGCARRQIQASVEQAMAHCRRDNLWRRLFHGEHHHLAMDKLKLSKLSFSELEELLNAVQSQSVEEIDPQLDCFLTMSPSWYQSLIKVLLTRFPQSCRHFDGSGIHYNMRWHFQFIFVASHQSLKVVFREPLPSQPQPSSSPPPQLVSMYHHLESVINTACYNLWTGLL
uniref:SZT2 subunit of KICSTOR complex n=1 Tax=Salmo trutta TaxID=8032 RepID=A0A673XBR0_SALTR